MKLFVFDVDGTLVYDGGKISNENICAIQDRLDKGDAIAIASGRPFVGIDIYLSEFKGKNRYALGANGSIIQDSNGTILNIDGLKMKDLVSIRNKYKNYIEPYGGEIYAYDKTGNVVTFIDSYWSKAEIIYNHVSVKIIDENNLDMDESILKVMVSAKEDVISNLKIDGEDENKYNIVLSDPKFLEFVNKSADKSEAVSFLANYLGISKNDIYTFGDQENDARMIKNYNGIAMGNAIELCKSNAKFITLDVKDSGIAYAFEKYISKNED